MSNKATAFPSDLVHPSKKAEKSYGVQIAKAIWSSNSTTGPSLFYNDRQQYDVYMKYYRGEQDVDMYKPVVGINPRNAKNSWVGGIRWQIKNYIKKRADVAISKMYHRMYDPVATAIDPLSIDRREDYKARVKTFMDHQEWLAEVQSMSGVNMLPEGMTMEELPINDEELQVHMENNHKLNDEIDLELGVKKHLELNRYERVKEEYDRDLFLLGVGSAYVGMDANAMPILKWRNPARIIVPRSEEADFGRIKYAGYIDEYTVSEFRKMHGGEFQKDVEERIIEEFARKHGDYEYDREYDYEDFNSRDVDKIKILHFEYETYDQHVYLNKKDKFGNDRMIEKDYDYYKTNRQQEKFREKYKDERKLYRKTYCPKLTGYWIVGSDFIFGYKRKENDTGRLGYKMYAPGMRDNKVVSPLKLMIPSADQLETYDKKIQQIVASAVPKGVTIDLFALRKAQFKMGGKDMSTQDIIEMYKQSGVLMIDSSEGYAPGSNSKPIIEMENGMAQDVVNYLNLMRHELEVLDEIIGINKVTSGSSLPERTGARVAQQMSQSTEVALDYLYRGDKYLTQEIFNELADLHIQSVKFNPPHVYNKMFGGLAVERMKKAFSRHAYGIGVEARPTDQEWQEFYLELNEYVKAGMLQPEDKIMIRRIQNLKQAESLMRVLMKRRKKEASEAAAANVQQQAQVQMQSNQQTHQNQMNIEQFKSQSEVSKISAELRADAQRHRWKLEEIQAQSALESMNKVRLANLEGEWKNKHIDKQGDEALEQVALKGSIDLKKEKIKPKPQRPK